MLNNRFVPTIAIVLTANGCGLGTPEDSTAAAEPSAAATTQTVLAMKARVSGSGMRLGPSYTPASYRAATTGVENFLASCYQEKADSSALRASDRSSAVTTPSFIVRHWTGRNLLSLRRKPGVRAGLGCDRGSDLATITSEQVLAERASRMLGFLGIDRRELRKTAVKEFAVDTRVPNQDGTLGPARKTVLGKKVFFWRSIGDIRVAGNRIVVTYDSDGELTQATVVWDDIDIGQSRLRSKLGEARVLQLADGLLSGPRFQAVVTKEHEVGTLYQIQREGLTATVTLKGYVRFLAQGPGNGFEGVEELFDIDAS